MKNKTLFLGLAVLVCLAFSALPSFAQEAGMENAIINVAAIAGRAVVSIGVEQTTRMPAVRRYSFRYPNNRKSPSAEEEPFRRFFSDFFGEMPERDFKQQGLGSGVIIDSEGYILTNEHVVRNADKINVTLPDGREFKGEVKGKDQRSDLAVIKINASNLPAATLGESDSLKIGQWVVAIGNPFGFAMQNPEPTVTAGVISALHRSLGRVLSRDRDYNDLIQTDAAINPGNSGGPLVNLKGEVVGINVAIFSTSGGYQGLGFAIPINSAKRIITQLKEGKKIVYGWLGVTVQDLSDDLAKQFALSDKNGALISKVLENSPAQKAGLKEGDVIRQIDNKNINNIKELLSTVGGLEVGRKVKIMVVRDKKQLVTEVEIGERPQDVEGAEHAESLDKWRGLSVEDLTSDIAKRFKTEEKKGVMVIEVEPGSSADQAGIIPGDIILEINKEAVKNIPDYQKATKEIKGNILIRTTRGYFIIKESEE